MWLQATPLCYHPQLLISFIAHLFSSSLCLYFSLFVCACSFFWFYTFFQLYFHALCAVRLSRLSIIIKFIKFITRRKMSNRYQSQKRDILFLFSDSKHFSSRPLTTRSIFLMFSSPLLIKPIYFILKNNITRNEQHWREHIVCSYSQKENKLLYEGKSRFIDHSTEIYSTANIKIIENIKPRSQCERCRGQRNLPLLGVEHRPTSPSPYRLCYLYCPYAI